MRRGVGLFLQKHHLLFQPEKSEVKEELNNETKKQELKT